MYFGALGAVDWALEILTLDNIMDRPITKLNLPVSKYDLEIVNWITAKEAEYIDEPFFDAAQFGGRIEGNVAKLDIKEIRTRAAYFETIHRSIEIMIIKLTVVKGDKTETLTDGKKILSLMLDLPESDYELATKKIDELRELSKKK